MNSACRYTSSRFRVTMINFALGHASICSLRKSQRLLEPKLKSSMTKTFVNSGVSAKRSARVQRAALCRSEAGEGLGLKTLGITGYLQLGGSRSRAIIHDRLRSGYSLGTCSVITRVSRIASRTSMGSFARPSGPPERVSLQLRIRGTGSDIPWYSSDIRVPNHAAFRRTPRLS